MTKILPTFKYELEISRGEEIIVAGVDEVGRGALAGPIVAAAVVFDFNNPTLLTRSLQKCRISDSKTLTEKQRTKADKVIRKYAVDLAIGEVTSREIDKHGIGAANVLAFKRALDGLSKCDFVLIDGRKFRGFSYKYRCLVKGESKSISIAAASIIAKVYRDKLMEELHKEFEIYNFARHKGYGSKSHISAILKHGPSPHHRKSFLKKISNSNHRLFIEK